MGVSKNNGTPKSSMLIGFSIINPPFGGTPIFGNAHIAKSMINLFSTFGIFCGLEYIKLGTKSSLQLSGIAICSCPFFLRGKANLHHMKLRFSHLKHWDWKMSFLLGPGLPTHQRFHPPIVVLLKYGAHEPIAKP